MRILALLALALLPGDRYLEDLREAIEKTGRDGYAYTVRGRFAREGEYAPEDLLTSRIRKYKSARHGEKILVRGPEGLWKTPDERVGEQVEGAPRDPDLERIMTTLRGAEAPHRIVGHLLNFVTRGRRPEYRFRDGRACRRYLLGFTRESLESSLREMLDKAVAAGAVPRPDRVRWSTAKGYFVVYVDRREGRLVHVSDERSVKLVYESPDEPDTVKNYRLEMKFTFSDWGGADPEVPPEIRERLGLR